MKVIALRRYPVKSLGGQAVERLTTEPWGPVGDRRWAVVDVDGKLKTARTVPAMLTVAAAPTTDGIILSHPSNSTQLMVPTPLDGPLVEINVNRQPVAHDAGEEVAQFLSEVLGLDVRLVWQPDPTQRSINERNGGLPGETLSLADAGPLLLTSNVSLAQLQEWLGPEPAIEMERFRPNVVIDGDEPFEEDHWRGVTIGKVHFRAQELCDRCAMTTVNPTTGERSGPEPLATLREHHLIDGKMMFGIRLVPILEPNSAPAPTTIAVGDRVVVD